MENKKVKEKSKEQEYLEQIELIEAIIEGKKIEKQQWFDLALGLSSGGETVILKAIINGKEVKEAHNVEKVQSSGNPSKMSDAVIKCLGAADEIDSEIDKLIVKKKEVTQTIEQLHSPIEYKILHMRYVQHIELKDIAAHFKKDYSWVTTTHGRALKHVQAIRNRKEK